MRTQILTTGLLVLALTGCSKKAETADPAIETKSEETETVTALNDKTCYQYVKDKDTVRMSLAMNANNANGELDYKPFEKDKSTGTFSGTFIGDTLFADYTFRAEGMTSVSEMVFLKDGNSLIQGSGAMEEKNDKRSFKNPKQVGFDKKGIVLMMTDCK